MAINIDRKYCYRITHIHNLPHLLKCGLVTKHHTEAKKEFVPIGNPEIIDVRTNAAVRIDDYGNIGDYVPFYFTPRSMMLFNIITGYYAPIVPKRSREEILVIRCLIDDLAQSNNRFFFTDGQANDFATNHYNNLKDLDKIDWDNIQNSKFDKSDGDYDRPRRYQAEFLVHHQVPIDNIELLCVHNDNAKQYVEEECLKAKIKLPVKIQPLYFF